MMLRIANAASFWGDQLDAPRRTVDPVEVDYLTLCYLDRHALAELVELNQQDAASGFVPDFLDAIQSLCPALYLQPQLRILTDAGGVRPRECAIQAGRLLAENGSGPLPVAVITGDNLLDRLEELMLAGCDFPHRETGQPLAELTRPIVSAHACLPMEPVVSALERAAKVVIAGHVARSSLVTGPASFAFGWPHDDWNQIGAAAVAGHILGQGTRATGGGSSAWQELALASIGYPLAEMQEDGSLVITKPPGSGGRVDVASVADCLSVENEPFGPAIPDVQVDRAAVELSADEADRVRVARAVGAARSTALPVTVAYHDGFEYTGLFRLRGESQDSKARYCFEMLKQRLQRAEALPERLEMEMICEDGLLCVSGGDRRRAVVQRLRKELPSLATAGPPGVEFCRRMDPGVRTSFAWWPTRMPRELVEPEIEVRTASQWAALAD